MQLIPSAEALRVESSNRVEEKMGLHISKGKGACCKWYFENFRSRTCYVKEEMKFFFKTDLVSLKSAEIPT